MLLADPSVSKTWKVALSRLTPPVPSKWQYVPWPGVIDHFGTAPAYRGLRKRLAASKDMRAGRRTTAESKSGVSRTQDLVLEGGRTLTGGAQQVMETVVGPNEVNKERLGPECQMRA